MSYIVSDRLKIIMPLFNLKMEFSILLLSYFKKDSNFWADFRVKSKCLHLLHKLHCNKALMHEVFKILFADVFLILSYFI